jgi:hypothetical protein
MLNRCWFDEEKCSTGIKMLESYKRSWNEKGGCWGENPFHSFASHGADAFRYLAIGLNLVKTGMTPDDTRRLREQQLSGGFYSSNPQIPPINPYGSLRI